MTDFDSDRVFWYCDRCGEKIFSIEESIEEDGLVYCKSCFTKLLEHGEV